MIAFIIVTGKILARVMKWQKSFRKRAELVTWSTRGYTQHASRLDDAREKKIFTFFQKKKKKNQHHKLSVLHQPQQHLTTAWENFTQRTSLAKELSFKLENLLTFLYKNLTFYCETVTSTDGILLFNYYFFSLAFFASFPGYMILHSFF